jgi:hypothetical protein
MFNTQRYRANPSAVQVMRNMSPPPPPSPCSCMTHIDMKKSLILVAGCIYMLSEDTWGGGGRCIYSSMKCNLSLLFLCTLARQLVVEKSCNDCYLAKTICTLSENCVEVHKIPHIASCSEVEKVYLK